MKNPIQASALTLGTARNADAFPAGLRVRARSSTTSAPMLPASSANRVCSHGSTASAAPWKNQGSADSAPLECSSCASDQRPHAGQHDEPRRSVRVHGERVQQERRRRERPPPTRTTRRRCCPSPAAPVPTQDRRPSTRATAGRRPRRDSRPTRMPARPTPKRPARESNRSRHRGRDAGSPASRDRL